MDEDRDGKVTIDEFVGACMKQVKVSLPNDARARALPSKREGGESGVGPTPQRRRVQGFHTLLVENLPLTKPQFWTVHFSLGAL